MGFHKHKGKGINNLLMLLYIGIHRQIMFVQSDENLQLLLTNPILYGIIIKIQYLSSEN